MPELELPEVINTKFAEWYDESVIKKPEYKLKRLDDRRGNRFYYEGDEEIFTRAGITSLLQRVLPPSYAITQWQKTWGDKADYMLDVSSRYGTSLHIVNKDWVTTKQLNEQQVQVGINCCKEYGASEDMVYKDFAAFMLFCEDYQVKPLLCEAMLKAQFNGEWFCLTLDLLCEITFKIKVTKTVTEKKQRKVKEQVQDGLYKSGKKAGLPRMRNKTRYESYEVSKEVTEVQTVTRLALVDFKSNFFERTEKEFYESHLFQLLAAKEAVKQNFGLDVDILMNYSPNAWRTEPSYSKKIWKVEEKDIALFNNVLEQARLRGYFRPQGKVFMNLPITPETKSNESYKFFSYEEYARFLEQQRVVREMDVPVEVETN